jgi:hypothetical protein
MAKITIKELSLTISQLVDIDPSQQHLIESAAIRAISTKEAESINGGWCLRIIKIGICFDK